MSDIWHVVWWTYLARPPHDAQADWAELEEHYRAVPRHAAAFSRALPPRYVPSREAAYRLSADEQTLLPGLLKDLAGDKGDRVAGGHKVLAAAFVATKVHLLFHCPKDDLAQVVGRLKSRLATLLFFSPAREGYDVLWGKGFWSARLLDARLVESTAAFVERQHGA